MLERLLRHMLIDGGATLLLPQVARTLDRDVAVLLTAPDPTQTLRTCSHAVLQLVETTLLTPMARRLQTQLHDQVCTFELNLKTKQSVFCMLQS